MLVVLIVCCFYFPGKRLINELQEATQSHQVRKDASKHLLTTYTLQKEQNQKEMNHKKMCLLLVEDVDIVFEQDEGFLYSLSQLLNTSKRPIVLTTSDVHSPHLSKFTSQYKVIKFNTVSDKILTSWLQLVCLLEGQHVTKNTIQELLLHNKGDVRKTMLHLQFWITSTGEHIKNRKAIMNVLKEEDCCEPLEVNCDHNDSSRLSWSVEVKAEETLRPSDCYLNDDILWWNTHEMLKMNASDEVEERRAVQHAAMILESQSFIDLVKGVLKIEDKSEVSLNSWSTTIKDSLELKENFQSCIHSHDVAEEIRRYILEDTVCMYKNARSKHDVLLNAGYPNMNQLRFVVKCCVAFVVNVSFFRWCKNRRNCDRSLTEVVPCFMRTDTKAVAVDYLSSLRVISRLEIGRQAINNKRGNRFYNYLEGLGIDCNEADLKTASSIFSSCSME